MWAVLTLVAALCYAGVQTRDPNYAVEVRVPDPDQPSDLVHTYRLVSLAWLDYLSRMQQQADKSLDIYYRVGSLPDQMRLKTPTSATTTRIYRFSDNEKHSAISAVFEQVVYSYLYDVLGMRSTVRLHRNAVDPVGVAVREGRSHLNRSLLLQFVDPPYGQSTPNLLVTNKRIPWTIWSGASTETLRFRRDYNMTEDILYRYFHNLGHAFGFGHYVGSENPRDPQRPTVPFRSVMYANYADARYAAPIPLPNDVDERAMPSMLSAYRRLIRDNVLRFNVEKLAPAMLVLMQAAARQA